MELCKATCNCHHFRETTRQLQGALEKEKKVCPSFRGDGQFEKKEVPSCFSSAVQGPKEELCLSCTPCEEVGAQPTTKPDGVNQTARAVGRGCHWQPMCGGGPSSAWAQLCNGKGSKYQLG